ncbi:MAG: DnaT-like ssDNA-binding protein [Limisphaerales bacterium]
MALVVVKEDGTGLANANSYAVAADGDDYHAAHLYASAWTGATAGNKDIALVMATRLIDAQCEFLGFHKSNVQALQWPRVQVPDREASGVFWAPGLVIGLGPAAPLYLSSDVVPPCVIAATCELARELLITDRTGPPLGEGLKSASVKTATSTKPVGTTGVASSASAASAYVYEKSDRRPIMTPVVEALLRRVLAGSPGKSTVKVVRA